MSTWGSSSISVLMDLHVKTLQQEVLLGSPVQGVIFIHHKCAPLQSSKTSAALRWPVHWSDANWLISGPEQERK